ncbi:cellulase family glycosylhydrolase [Aquimarina sp. RZ0]|uniref:cellulase family glycosylhydrolase n=1 Tax=Aquimarina sp. RZ0 TaxID=2607730 RepID=UPI0011F33A45|nr:cellulase family glycosylhydrolase [Aquimarina sp. RZ0]KAA1243286.1 cellulase family glycosylhydrolase [Aquimarina sp. RZ0]
MVNPNKNIYRASLILSFLVLNGGIIYGISQLFLFLNTGADRTSMLHLTKKSQQVYLPKIVWKDTLNPGRPMEAQTLSDIQQNYLDAWYVKQVAYKTNDSFGINDFYTQSARKNLYKTIDNNTFKKYHIDGTTTKHTTYLDFYSADGQLVVFTDKDVREYQKIYKEENLVFEAETHASYKIMMLLEDGFWKIRHMVKERYIPLQDSITSNKKAVVVDDKLIVNGESFHIKGINYYPQKSPWDMFGDHFDINVIAKDFEIIKNAGLNTIRIFIQYEDFGKATVLHNKLTKLKNVLDLASQEDLQVVVTLFDFYGDYSILDWTLTHRHAEQIVSRFKDHDAILAWDLKNEPNLDFQNRGKDRVLSWLKEMCNQIRSFDPNHLITIGWSDPESMQLLSEEMDFLSFHYYRSIDDFIDVYDKLLSNTNKPVLLQEFGISSNKGLWSPFGTSEEDQASYYRDFQKLLATRKLHYMSWTLYDFTEVPTAVVGKLPWRKHQQKHFGFIDKDGKKKKAFAFITAK